MPFLTIALLLMIAAMIGIIYFHHQTQRKIDALTPEPEEAETFVSEFLSALEHSIEVQISDDILKRFTDLEATVLADGRKTRKDIVQTLGTIATVSEAETEDLKALIKAESADQYVGVVSVTNAAVEQLSEKIDMDGKLTRERIAQVKTREADEERDDQRAKANVRLTARKSKGVA